MSHILAQLAAILEERKRADPELSYVASLYAAGTEAILNKISEEAMEVVLAGRSGERQAIVHETADLWFHTLVLLSHQGVEPGAVLTELQARFGRSGHAEKASRINKIND